MIKGFKIGFMPAGSYFKHSVDEICYSLKKIGYDSIEWHTAFLCPEKKSCSELEEIIRKTHEHGLEISEVVVQQDLVVPDREEREKNIGYSELCIKVLSSLGIDKFNIFTGPVPWGKTPVLIGRDISEGKAWDMVFRAIDRLLPLAEASHAYLTLENVWGMLSHDFYSARFLIDKYNSPHLCVNFDPSHDILAGNTDIGWIIKQWGNERIKHIHLKDAAGIQTDGKFVFPLLGEGYVNWNSFFESLKEIGYQGYLSVEFESFRYLKGILNNDMEEAARISYELLKKIIPGED